MSPRGKALLAFGVLAALAVIVRCRLGNPVAASDDAPPTVFSATRALATLREVSLDAPHPPGSRAHDVVRDRIVARLRALDYDVDVQRTFACGPAASCGTVENLIATIPGRPRGQRGVLVVTHYDSVPAGPGASDDGTGVATALEIARAIRHEEMANPIGFLIDDGEEAGLLGAEAFVTDPARARDTAFVINIEARGTGGTPFLFETTRERRWLVPIVAGALPHPVTTSLFATIYEMLPNNTDLTVFKGAGIAGINFAYLGAATQYHTPLDSFANVDEGSVQRRGDQVLAMVRAFGNAVLDTGEAENAVWFDVLAMFVVWWPATWTPWILAVAFALLAGAIGIGARRRDIAATGVVLGLAAFVAATVLAFALGQAVGWVATWRAPGALFPPNVWPRVTAAWCGGIAVALFAAALARRRASFDSVFAGVALAWDLVALVIALRLPGAAYVALVPGAILSGLALLRIAARVGEEVVCTVALITTTVVFIPFAFVMPDALGPGSVGIVAVMLALVSLSFAPMLDALVRHLAPAFLAAAALLALVGALVPNTSPSHPHQRSLAHVTDATGAARWQVDRALPALRAIAPFKSQHVFPWVPDVAADVAPAPATGLPPPSVNVTRTERDGRHVTTLDIASQREAPRLRIAWRSDAPIDALRINGVAPPPQKLRNRGSLAPNWHRIVVWGSSARIEIVTRDAAPAEAIVSDDSFGLPASGAALIQTRDASGAVPVHDGDVTSVEQRVKW